MADEKKAGDKSTGGTTDPFVEMVWVLLAVFAGLYILSKLIVLLNEFISGNLEDSPIITKIREFFLSLFAFLPIVRVVLVGVSVAAVAGVVYLFRKLTQLRLNEKKLLYPETDTTSSDINPQWERILSHVESLNKNDWRLAIIEADIMLGGILDRLQLPGDTMGEKMKAVEKSDFTTIDFAWEAHKIRNQIAHEGEGFVITQREARRVIELYRRVFEEFAII
jgi:hypothetical protein